MNLSRAKPVCLCLHGTSLQHLADQIESFKRWDVYWATVNSFVHVDEMLKKIDKQVDFLFVPNQRQINAERVEIFNFLSRPDTLFITSTRGAMEYPSSSMGL